MPAVLRSVGCARAGQPPVLVSGGGPDRILKQGEVEFVQVFSDQHPPRLPVGPGAGEQRHAQQLRRPVFGKLGRARYLAGGAT